MKLLRRRFLHLVAGAAALPAASRVAWSQAYPSRRCVLSLASPAQRARYRRTPRGAMVVGAARAAILWDNRRALQQHRHRGRCESAPGRLHAPHRCCDQHRQRDALREPQFRFHRDLAPVASIASTANVMVVNTSVPAKTIPEFIAHAKANPNKLNMASSGIGTSGHVTGEMFKLMTASRCFMSRIAGVSFPICSAVRCTCILPRCRGCRVHPGRQSAGRSASDRNTLGCAAGHPGDR